MTAPDAGEFGIGPWVIGRSLTPDSPTSTAWLRALGHLTSWSSTA